MIKTYKNFKIFFLLSSFAGVLFSGYMSGVKLFSQTCAFGESCPLFLGMPACYFGFIIFFLLFIFSIVFIIEKWETAFLSKSIFFASLIGVLFSGYFAVVELPLLFINGFKSYLFGLPTCIIGFIFFIVIFVVSVIFNRKIRRE